MKLESLLQDLREHFTDLEIEGSTVREITGISCRPEEWMPGGLFVAVKAFLSYNQWIDGNKLVQDSLKHGIKAVVAEKGVKFDVPGDVTFIRLGRPRKALAILAASFYGKPFQAMKTIGVTGTNGKTTTAHLLSRMFNESGISAGVLGTVGYFWKDRNIPAVYTTPLASELHKLGHEMRRDGVSVAVMEVSSHAIDLDRVYGLPFNIGIFTNLTQDHLDYHHTMKNYLDVKLRLFRNLKPGADFPNAAVVNGDDPHATSFIKASSVKTLTYGTADNLDFYARCIKSSLQGSEFDLIASDQGSIRIRTPMAGHFNLYNVLAAFAAAVHAGLPAECLVETIKHFRGVPGRFETVKNSGGFLIIIDYAHTPDALKRVIETVRALPINRLITVFGCGGDRDKSKRPIMGGIAEKFSDKTILTSDNPRTEDPLKIIQDIDSGVSDKRRRMILADRREAIAQAVKEAGKNDAILIAGKGHENYQIVGTEKFPFIDKEEVSRALADAGLA